MIIEFRDNQYGKNVLPCKFIEDEPTNGDIIKAMFPHIEVENELSDCCLGIYKLDTEDENTFISIYKEWWNAPYKGGEK